MRLSRENSRVATDWRVSFSAPSRPALNTHISLTFADRAPLPATVVHHDESDASRFRVRAAGSPGPEFDSATFARLGASWAAAHAPLGAPLRLRVGGGAWLDAVVAEHLSPTPRVRVRLVGEDEDFDSAAFEAMGIMAVFEEAKVGGGTEREVDCAAEGIQEASGKKAMMAKRKTLRLGRIISS